MTSNQKTLNVEIESGLIRGCKKESALGREYFNFQRIPYMKAPVGKLRFRDPVAPDSWTDVLDCTEQGAPFCNVNFLNGQYEGDLDAMFINVYTNNISPSKPYPVMVWIHGAGINAGNATTELYGPDYLMEKDVVVVTFQYRMGVFGFLSLDDPSLNIPGNAQFRDHIFALKWIQRNIDKFGGDKNNVTLFGESWGGGSTSYHMISEKSRGLFHRGILMSGSALNGIYSLTPRRDWAVRLCRELNYNGPTDDKSLLEFLEEADPKEMVLATQKIVTDSEKADENLAFAFGPTIEPYDNGNIFLSDEIMKMSKNCWGNGIDILIGGTSNECAVFEVMAQIDEEYNKVTNFNRYIPRELDLKLDDDRREELRNILMLKYYGQAGPSRDNMDGAAQAMNDFCVWHPASRIVRQRATSSQAGKSFVYRFDIDSENNLMKKFMNLEGKFREPIHADDVFYFFKTSLESMPKDDSDGFKGIKVMVAMLTSFATNGNPNVPELGLDVEWAPATFDIPLKGVNINEKQSEVIELPENKRVEVCDEVFKRLGRDLY